MQDRDKVTERQGNLPTTKLNILAIGGNHAEVQSL